MMLPMAIPSLGGMTIEVITLFVVPLLYSLVEEVKEAEAAVDAAVLILGILAFALSIRINWTEQSAGEKR